MKTVDRQLVILTLRAKLSYTLGTIYENINKIDNEVEKQKILSIRLDEIFNRTSLINEDEVLLGLINHSSEIKLLGIGEIENILNCGRQVLVKIINRITAYDEDEGPPKNTIFGELISIEDKKYRCYLTSKGKKKGKKYTFHLIDETNKKVSNTSMELK